MFGFDLSSVRQCLAELRLKPCECQNLLPPITKVNEACFLGSAGTITLTSTNNDLDRTGRRRWAVDSFEMRTMVGQLRFIFYLSGSTEVRWKPSPAMNDTLPHGMKDGPYLGMRSPKVTLRQEFPCRLLLLTLCLLMGNNRCPTPQVCLRQLSSRRESPFQNVRFDLF